MYYFLSSFWFKTSKIFSHTCSRHILVILISVRIGNVDIITIHIVVVIIIIVVIVVVVGIIHIANDSVDKRDQKC